MSRTYDNHTLYVNSGVATKAQLTTAFHRALKDVSKTLNRPVTTAFKVNVVIVHGNYVGYSYVRVQNPEVYNMLIGKNPDGTERVEYIDDPNWQPPAKASVIEDEIDFETFMSAPTNNKSWAELMDEEEEMKPAKIRQLLPPLMKLPSYQYDQEQIKHVTKLLEEQHHGLSETKVTVPTHGHFEVSRAYVSPVDDRFAPNILCSRNIPAWITENDLKVAFSPYASDITTKHRRKVNGRFISEAYPYVTINNGRVAFVTFDPVGHDAQFALLMTRKLELTSHDRQTSVQLVFNHAFRTNRE